MFRVSVPFNGCFPKKKKTIRFVYYYKWRNNIDRNIIPLTNNDNYWEILPEKFFKNWKTFFLLLSRNKQKQKNPFRRIEPWTFQILIVPNKNSGKKNSLLMMIVIISCFIGMFDLHSISECKFNKQTDRDRQWKKPSEW